MKNPTFYLVLTISLLIVHSCANHEGTGKQKLFLSLQSYNLPDNSLISTSLGSLCKSTDVLYDAYLATDRKGGIFSDHGSTVIGGHHAEVLLRTLQKYETTIINIDSINIFGTIINGQNVYHYQGLPELYDFVCKKLDRDFPDEIIAVQTKGLKGKLNYIFPYLYPEATYRNTIIVPLELDKHNIQKMKKLGVNKILTVKHKNPSFKHWNDQGFEIESAIQIADQDSLFSITKQIAERWIEKADGVDLCEPVLATNLIPFGIRNNRLQLMSDHTTEKAIGYLPELIKSKDQKTIYARYNGGSIVKGVWDLGLFSLFKNNLSIEVLEPGRPVLTVQGVEPSAFPQPEFSCFDLEPSDNKLRQWAKEKKVLVSMMMHSGEMSHDDAMVNFIDLATVKKVSLGMGMHFQRYRYSPWSIELIHVPQEEGGALGLAEPVLHSSGCGIIAESMADPKKVANMMKKSKEQIAKIAGERFAPKGVYCYLDANPEDWNHHPVALWEEIRKQGFEYVISSVEKGKNKILYRKDDFVVINQAGFNMYPHSPFILVKKLNDMEETLNDLEKNDRAGWVMFTIDSPLYGYSPYLSEGHRWGYHKTMDEFFNFVAEGDKTGRFISVTPNTLVRYAKIINE